jgi:hypothetical protein
MPRCHAIPASMHPNNHRSSATSWLPPRRRTTQSCAISPRTRLRCRRRTTSSPRPLGHLQKDNDHCPNRVVLEVARACLPNRCALVCHASRAIGHRRWCHHARRARVTILTPPPLPQVAPFSPPVCAAAQPLFFVVAAPPSPATSRPSPLPCAGLNKAPHLGVALGAVEPISLSLSRRSAIALVSCRCQVPPFGELSCRHLLLSFFLVALCS